jgi:hypothetical protein
MAVIPGVNTSSIMLKPRERAACTNLSSARTVVGALGPKSAGAPNPWRATSCSASSSLIVSSHAWPVAVHESLASEPMSGS